LSLTSVDNDILLWSYYNNHTGFAIELSDLPIDNNAIFGPFPINYVEQYVILFPRAIELSNEHLLYLTNIKSSAWKHEKEWRVLLKRDNLSIPDYPPSNINDKNRLVNYSPEIIKSVILGFKFFKEFIPYEIDKKTYKFTIEEDNNSDVLSLKLKLLNHLILNNISVKQIQTKNNNSFCIEANEVSLEIIESNKTYLVRRITEKKTPNIRFAHKPGDSR
jgi:hypothetical protein